RTPLSATAFATFLLHWLVVRPTEGKRCTSLPRARWPTSCSPPATAARAIPVTTATIASSGLPACRYRQRNPVLSRRLSHKWFWVGHGFSRADWTRKKMRALAPEDLKG